MTLLSAQAQAEGMVIPDLAASPELRYEASAVSLLLRACLRVEKSPLISRRELALALEGIARDGEFSALVVPAHEAGPIMARLGADRLLMLDLSHDVGGLTASGVLVGTHGKKLARIVVMAPTGALGELAKKIAEKIAPLLDATVGDPPPLGLVDLRPFLSAERAFYAGDGREVSRSLDLALPQGISGFPPLRELVEALADDASLPPLSRGQAKLLLGDALAAESLASQGLVTDAKSPALHALRARALAGLRKFPDAEQEIRELVGHRPYLALAQFTLALARRDGKAKNDLALTPLLGRPAGEWRMVLPIVAGAPKDALGTALEIAALTAAESLSAQEPVLATLVAHRAMMLQQESGKAASLIRIEYLNATQIQLIRGRLALAAADEALLPLSLALKARDEEAKRIQVNSAQKQTLPSGPPGALVKVLQEQLQRFDWLYDPALSGLMVSSLPGSGEPFYWPFFVRRTRLQEGLTEALGRSPWELKVNPPTLSTESLSEERFSEEGLVELAKEMGTPMLLLYRIRPAGFLPWVNLEWILHDGKRQRTERMQSLLVGRATGLVVVNPLWVAVVFLGAALSLLWAVIITFRGQVVVRVEWDPDAKDEAFAVFLSQSSRSPALENVTVLRARMERMGRRKRRFEAWNIEQVTTFKGIPKGTWNVFLFGVYTRGRQNLLLNEPLQTVEVIPRKSALVVFSLEASHAEFKLLVVDSQGPVEGARVWIDEERAKAQSTGKDGLATVHAPKGYHVFHVNARGLTVDRPYHVVKSKTHEMTVNLVWERRQEYISRALERQTDDAVEYPAAHSMERPPSVATPNRIVIPPAEAPTGASRPPAAPPLPPVAISPASPLPVPSRPGPPIPRLPSRSIPGPPSSSAAPPAAPDLGMPIVNLDLPTQPPPETGSKGTAQPRKKG